MSTRTRGLAPNSHDAVLQIRILDAFKASARVDASNVSVVVRNRSATLFGSVAGESECLLLQKLASGISGIIEVTNRVKLAAV